MNPSTGNGMGVGRYQPYHENGKGESFISGYEKQPVARCGILTENGKGESFISGYEKQPVASCGILRMEEPAYNMTSYSTSGGKNRCECTDRVKHEDKESGSYTRFTKKDKYSSGEYTEKSAGKGGWMEERKSSSTLKIGDGSGYTEIYSEQRLRTVDFENQYGDGNGTDYIYYDSDEDYYGDGSGTDYIYYDSDEDYY